MSPSRYPPCSSDQLIKLSCFLGYVIARRKGDHVHLVREGSCRDTLTIVDCGEIKATGTRISIIKELEKQNPGEDIRGMIYGKRKH